MEVTFVQEWIADNPLLALVAGLVALIVIYLVARLIFGRGLTSLASITRNKYDDIIVKKLRPYRAAWLAPFSTT